VTMPKKTKELCAVCGKPGVIHRRLTRTFGKGASLLVVENVPVVACPNCGESYMTAETLDEI
jgi:YgiT-type zinc finger domain-containing protein